MIAPCVKIQREVVEMLEVDFRILSFQIAIYK
jgi:hypothetical protein